jgi:hypothetical protein
LPLPLFSASGTQGNPFQAFLDEFIDALFDAPYASDGKIVSTDRAKDGLFAPVFQMSKKNALRKAMIRLNGPTRDTFMTIDVDAAHGAEAWEIANLPIPNFIITNPQNGHAHLVYWHARPIRKETDGTKSHAELYRKAVWVALTRAMEGGDLGYTEGLTKNPFSARWCMSIGTTHKYTLAELAAHLDLSQTRMVDIREGYDALNEYDRPKAAESRNCQVFWAVARRSWSAYRRVADEDWDEWVAKQVYAVHDKSFSANPLSDRELLGIIKSIVDWTREYLTRDGGVTIRHKGGRAFLSPLMRARSKAGKDTTKLMQERMLAELMAVMVELQSQGITVSQSILADKSGRSLSTVKRYWARLCRLSLCEARLAAPVSRVDSTVSFQVGLSPASASLIAVDTTPPEPPREEITKPAHEWSNTIRIDGVDVSLNDIPHLGPFIMNSDIEKWRETHKPQPLTPDDEKQRKFEAMMERMGYPVKKPQPPPSVFKPEPEYERPPFNPWRQRAIEERREHQAVMRRERDWFDDPVYDQMEA